MLALACACSCDDHGRGSLTTDTDSETLPERQRLEFLTRYLRPKSPIVDAEYLIHYRDNSAGLVPGPSDWDIRAVLQVEGDTAAWHERWAPCAVAATDPAWAWARPLLQRRAAWRSLRSLPRCFRDPRSLASMALLYEQEHLVLYRNSSERTAAPAGP